MKEQRRILIVGQGNWGNAKFAPPDERLQQRNIGFLVLDKIAQNNKHLFSGFETIYGEQAIGLAYGERCISHLKDKKENKFYAENDVHLYKAGGPLDCVGGQVAEYAKAYDIESRNIIYIHTDFGTMRNEVAFQRGGSGRYWPKKNSKGESSLEFNYGVESMKINFTENDFWRIKIGVNDTSPDYIHSEDYIKYVWPKRILKLEEIGQNGWVWRISNMIANNIETFIIQQVIPETPGRIGVI